MNSLFLNKKALLFLFAAAAINFCFPADAGIFCDNGSFQMAKAVKLGRGNAYSVGGQAELAGKTELTKEKPCDKNCVSCDKTTGTCSKCASGYYLNNNQCSLCSSAINHCLLCSDAQTCLQCETPAILTPNKTCKICACTDGTKCNTQTAECDICSAGEKCGCTGEKVSDGTGKCVEGCLKTAETCAEENGGTAADWRVEGTGTQCACATDKKYVMLTDQHPTMKYSPEKYSRIKAVKDFGTIKAGTLGGYIEKEANLSQTGNAWVGCDSSGCAVVMGDAKVYGNALVTGGGRTESLGSADGYGGATLVAGSAEIYGNAKILKGSEIFGGKVYGNATFHGTEVYSGAPTKPANPTEEAAAMSIAGEVFGDAHIYAGGRLGGSGSAGPNNNPKVYGNAILAGGDGTKTACWARVTYLGQVYENAKIFRCGEVSGGKVHGSAIVRNDLFGVSGNADVYGNAVIEGHCNVQGNAKMYGNAKCSPASSSSGVPYVCGNAVLSGTAQVTAKTGSKNAICKNSYSKGDVSWQESYCSSKNCPQ